MANNNFTPTGHETVEELIAGFGITPDGGSSGGGSSGGSGGSGGSSGGTTPAPTYNITPEQQANIDAAAASLGYDNQAGFNAANPISGITGNLAALTASLTNANKNVAEPVKKRHPNQLPQPGVGISMTDFQNDARESVQSSIDAINASYVSLLKRQQENEEDIEGQTRASAARGGDLQSSAYSAREQGMQEKFGDQRAGLEAQKQSSIAQVEAQAQQIAQNWAQIELANQNQQYNQAQAAYEANAKLGADMITTLGASGTKWEDLSPEIQQQMMDTTGMGASYVQNKMKLSHLAAIQSTATTNVNADGSLQFTYMDPATGEIQSSAVEGVYLPQGITNVSIQPSGDIVYTQNGKLYYDSTYSKDIMANNKLYKDSLGDEEDSNEIIPGVSNRTTINTTLKYMMGALKPGSGSQQENSLMTTLKELGIKSMDELGLNADSDPNSNEFKSLVNLFDNINQGTFPTPGGGSIELSKEDRLLFKNNIAEWAKSQKGLALEVFKASTLDEKDRF